MELNKGKIAKQKKEAYKLMNEYEITKISESQTNHSKYWDNRKDNKKYKGIPFSTTSVLEQPKAQNHKEILVRLDFNEKLKILDELVEKLENNQLP